MRKLWILAIIAVPLPSAGQLYISPQAIRAMARISQDTLEIPLCLYGTPDSVLSAEQGLDTESHRAWFHTHCSITDKFIGTAHNHPVQDADGDRNCFFKFPRTTVPTGDLDAFRKSELKVSIIVCGDSLVYIQPDEKERRILLKESTWFSNFLLYWP